MLDFQTFCFVFGFISIFSACASIDLMDLDFRKILVGCGMFWFGILCIMIGVFV